MGVDESVWRAWIGLGGNVPNGDGRGPEETLRQACEVLGQTHCILAGSSFWRTEPVGPVREQPAFFNAALGLETRFSPTELLAELMAVERIFGRTRGSVLKGPRTLDLDILLLEQRNAEGLWTSQIVQEPHLTVPHPEMHRRRFVLAPLVEIAADVQHPELGQSVRDLYEALPMDEAVERLPVAPLASRKV